VQAAGINGPTSSVLPPVSCQVSGSTVTARGAARLGVRPSRPIAFGVRYVAPPVSPFRLRLRRRVSRPRVDGRVIRRNEFVSRCVSWRGVSLLTHGVIGDPWPIRRVVAETIGGR
jgi:hypothetical protein